MRSNLKFNNNRFFLQQHLIRFEPVKINSEKNAFRPIPMFPIAPTVPIVLKRKARNTWILLQNTTQLFNTRIQKGGNARMPECQNGRLFQLYHHPLLRVFGGAEPEDITTRRKTCKSDGAGNAEIFFCSEGFAVHSIQSQKPDYFAICQ